MKRMIHAIMSTALLFTLFSVPVFAEETDNQTQYGCTMTTEPIPEIGEAILIEDNSYTIETRAAAPVTRTVNQTYSIRIQDSSGSCVSTAKVSVTGSYSYYASTGEIESTAITAKVISAPSNWTVGIASQWTTVSGTSISHSIYYYSKVDDPYSCMVGGGNWYSGATFTIK